MASAWSQVEPRKALEYFAKLRAGYGEQPAMLFHEARAHATLGDHAAALQHGTVACLEYEITEHARYLIQIPHKFFARECASLGFTLPAAGKTGTSRDGWFAGFTSNLLTIVWIGYDDYSDLNLEGSKSALPVSRLPWAGC